MVLLVQYHPIWQAESPPSIWFFGSISQWIWPNMTQSGLSQDSRNILLLICISQEGLAALQKQWPALGITHQPRFHTESAPESSCLGGLLRNKVRMLWPSIWPMRS